MKINNNYYIIYIIYTTYNSLGDNASGDGVRGYLFDVEGSTTSGATIGDGISNESSGGGEILNNISGEE